LGALASGDRTRLELRGDSNGRREQTSSQFSYTPVAVNRSSFFLVWGFVRTRADRPRLLERIRTPLILHLYPTQRRGVITEEGTQFIHERIGGFTDNYGVVLRRTSCEDDRSVSCSDAKPTTDLVGVHQHGQGRNRSPYPGLRSRTN